MRKKLSGWKAPSLSFAGRISLAQSSLCNISGYILQTAPIPAVVCEEVEKSCRDFIWGTTANARKCHLIGWKTICSPKEEGGLGFRDLKILNKAYMLKLGWQLISQPNKLWVRIMKAKYGCGPQAMPTVRPHTNCSRTWHGIATGWPLIQSNMFWAVRNGRDTRFWKDHWIPGVDSLFRLLHAQIPNGEEEFSVNNYVANDQWDWIRLRRWIPE